MEHIERNPIEHTPPPKKDSFFKELLKTALIALIIVVPIRIFIAQPFVVQGASMSPTFESGEYLVVDQLSYRFNDPERGDVIVFRYPNDPSVFFIKRIIGLPGETVAIKDSAITITNTEGASSVLPPSFTFDLEASPTETRTLLGDDEYFVMGDNRDESSDSRTWGALHEDFITGKAFIRLLPVTEIEVLPGDQ